MKLTKIMIVVVCAIAAFLIVQAHENKEQNIMSEIVMVYITMPSEEKAKEIARVLLERHLIACATMMPCKSMYTWEGKIQDDQEVIMFAKTTQDKFEELKSEVTKIHPYQVPCILKIAADANAPYAAWVNNEVKNVK